MAMLLKDIYNKPIERFVNPAVSATKFDAKTIETEIKEYVFTDEIINGLYRILNAIKNNRPYDHVGIWIDGYYGSGKSHFLKYLDYLISPETRDEAFKYLLEAVRAIDPMDDKHQLQFERSELEDIARWMKNAVIDTCIFNLETSYDTSTDKKKAFLHVFWNEFNGKRGLNKFNITLAQTLEKPLMDKGVFEEFKARIAEVGGNWEDANEAANIIDNELDWVLDIACELAPTLSKDSIRERIIKRDTVISIDRFAEELKAYLKDKGDNYRLILLADEVSQFINKERDRYLNLQEIITKLSEACDNKVWVACTAQQDLSEIMDDCNINDEKDKEGKIKGRFEVKVSLKGTQPEVITQKRILDKKPDVKGMLGDMYDDQHTAFDLQFKLPPTYEAYTSQDSFVDYYPFVPYQFKLIMQVFNSFLNLGYVAKEVKGNERSIIKVVHATAKNSAKKEEQVGKFISFDELYNNMFEEGLQARGQRAVDNALQMAKKYDRNPAFARRVVNVLFMVCNISPTDQLLFPANIDNITTLLINDTTTPRLNIKNEVEKVVEFLCDNNIIRREQGRNGAPDYYSFYSEEEMKVAELIKSQNIDNSTQADKLDEIIEKALKGLRNKVTYGTRSFAVGLSIKQRTYLSNTPDVVVEFVTDHEDLPILAMNNANNRLLYYMGDMLHENRQLYSQFIWYCKVQKYMATPPTSEENDAIRKEFSKQATATLENVIKPGLLKILDTCPIISGVTILDDPELTSKKGNDRFVAALNKHMASIYTKALLVDNPRVPRNTADLKSKITRQVQPGDYEGLNEPLTEAERDVENYLNKQYVDVNVADVVAKFAKAPYGWDSICTLYIVNELVRRHKRAYSFGNDPNVEVAVVASKLATETNKFTLRQAAAISQELLHSFTDAWKSIFGISQAFSTSDSTQIFRQARESENLYSLGNIRKNYRKLLDDNRYNFMDPVRDFVELVDAWIDERDPEKFFRKVIDSQAQARELFDTCKEIKQFLEDQLSQYKTLVAYARQNTDNFTFVPEDLQPMVAKLKALEDAKWPISIREYVKARNAIDAALDEVKKEIRKQIAAAYNETFDQLERAADEQGVSRSILANRENIIFARTQSDSIPVLKTNTNTDSFFAEQAAKIQQEYNRLHPAPTPPTPGGGTPTPPQPAHRKPISIKLRTRQVTPLSSEAEVDNYLRQLKQQLMHHIDNGDTLIVY